MSNVANVTAAKPANGGAVRIAPYGTQVPTDAKTALSSAWKTLGYISEDGYENENSPESAQVKAWCGDVVLSGETGKADNFKFTLLEYMNEDVLKAIYGDSNVVTASNGMVAIHANNLEHSKCSWCIEEVLKSGKVSRTVIANGTITTIDTIAHKPSEPIKYGVTIAAMPDSKHQATDSNGNSIDDTHVTYIE